MKLTNILTTTLCLTSGLILPLRAIEPTEESPIAQSALVNQSSWQPYDSKDGRFAVRWPGQPETRTLTIPIAQQPTDWTVFRVQDDTGLYAVAYSDLIPDVIEAGKDEVLSSIQKTLVAEFNWVVLAKNGRAIEIDGFPGREFIGTQDNKLSVLRLYLADRRLYALMTTSQDVETLGRFLNSFALQTWQPYVSQEGRFSVSLPMLPREETTDAEQVAGKQFTWNVVEARHFNAPADLYAVAYTDVSPADLQQGQDALLDLIGANIVEQWQLKILDAQGTPISLNGNPGRAYLASTDTGRIVAFHLYLVGERLYGVGARSEDITQISQFLSSFKVQ